MITAALLIAAILSAAYIPAPWGTLACFFSATVVLLRACLLAAKRFEQSERNKATLAQKASCLASLSKIAEKRKRTSSD